MCVSHLIHKVLCLHLHETSWQCQESWWLILHASSLFCVCFCIHVDVPGGTNLRVIMMLVQFTDLGGCISALHLYVVLASSPEIISAHLVCNHSGLCVSEPPNRMLAALYLGFLISGECSTLLQLHLTKLAIMWEAGADHPGVPADHVVSYHHHYYEDVGSVWCLQ